MQSLTLKEKVNPLKNFKEKASEEGPSYKNLLLSMVRLIHANPLLMLNVSILLLKNKTNTINMIIEIK